MQRRVHYPDDPNASVKNGFDASQRQSDGRHQYIGDKRRDDLAEGATDDDTDSHIDTLVRFAPNNTLVYVKCDAKEDEHFNALDAMEKQLQSFKTQNNTPYTLIDLPWPKPVFDDDNTRLPATYANYLIINNTVLVPTYNDDNDALALAQVQKAYPAHTIIGVNCLPIIEQFGSLHCITMQLPRGFLAGAAQ